jgi:putative hydrolase of the HAD superfamily
LDEDLLNLLGELRQAGNRTALLSNNSLEVLDSISESGLEGLLDVCVISAQIGIMKPDPRSYQVVLDGLGVPSRSVAFVDDTEENVEGARELGLVALHYRPDMDLRALLAPWLSR